MKEQLFNTPFCFHSSIPRVFQYDTYCFSALTELNRKWSDELTGNNQYCKYRYVKFGKTAIIIGNLTANSNNNISITFPFEFKLTPSASVTLESSASSTINPLITQISTTSFRADSTPGSTSKTAARFIIIGEIE